MRAVSVADAGDPRLDEFRDLTRADRRPDRPGGRGLVIAEGTVVVRRLAASTYPVRALLGVRRRFDELRTDLEPVAAPYYVTDADTMAAVVGFHLNRGVLATADRVAHPEPGELLRAARRIAVLEGVGDHENLGSIFRNAAGLGIDAVLLAGRCADPLYRRSVRVSMGTVLQVPFAPLPTLSDGGMEMLRAAGFTTLALTPRPAATVLSTGLVDPSDKVAIVLGSEGPGLTDATLDVVDRRVRIRMSRQLDSLNVATAGAIAFAVIGMEG